jgi:transposase
MERYVGLDVHSKNSVYAIQDESGQVVGKGTVPTTPEGLQHIRDHHGLPEGTPVALESGTNAFAVVDDLRQLGFNPQVIDAYEVRMKASRPLQKCDRRDAFELCDGLRRGIYRNIVWIPPRSTRLTREIISRRRHFVRLKTSQVNAAKRLLRGWGLGKLSRSLKAASGWEKLLDSLAADPELRGFIQCHQAAWQAAQEQVKKLEQQLQSHTAHLKPELKRLMTAPGVGPVVASTFLAVVGEARRFSGAKKLASYAGIVPSTFQSGERDRHGHITRRGSSELRSMLCEAAHHAEKASSPLNPFFTKIKMRRGHRTAVVAVAHRLCRILYAIMRDGTTFDLAKTGVEEGRFEKVLVRRYRQTTSVA